MRGRTEVPWTDHWSYSSQCRIYRDTWRGRSAESLGGGRAAPGEGPDSFHGSCFWISDPSRSQIPQAVAGRIRIKTVS